LLDRLEKFKIVFYFTDGYEAYKTLIPANRLFQGKDGTHGIERNNCRQRHWFARFKRKSALSSYLRVVVVRMILV
jgi:insertion element IS1 protein InsB